MAYSIHGGLANLGTRLVTYIALQEHLRMLRCRMLRISSLTSAMISSRLSSEGQPAWPVTEILAGYL